MKIKDIEFLLKLEEIERDNLSQQLQELINQKQELINKTTRMNNAFKQSKASLDDAPYLQYRAIENQKIALNINEIEGEIDTIRAQIKEQVPQTKSYEMLIDTLKEHDKKQFEQQQETQIENYTLYQYLNKPSA